MLQDRRSAVLLRTAYTVTVIGIFLYFLTWQLNFYLAESIKQGIYLFFPPVLFAGVLFFRKLKDGIEIKLVAAYLLWVVITRVINGDRVLSKEYLFVLDLSLMLPFMSLGLVLDRAGRRRVLNWLSVILGVYFFVLGVLCIYTFVTDRNLINPITGGYLTACYRQSKNAISALDTNPNTIAFWFMMPLLLLVYQFFACNNRMCRVPILLSALMYGIVIAFTECRSVKISVSLCAGILTVLLMKRRTVGWKRLFAACTLAVCFLLAVPACYACFGIVEYGGEQLVLLQQKDDPAPTDSPEAEETALVRKRAYHALLSKAELPEGGESSGPTERQRLPDLEHFSSGRSVIYKAALEAIKREPMILLRGSAAADVMKRVNTVMVEWHYGEKAHLHNCFLQTIFLTGLPGLLVVLTLSVLLLVRFIRLCFLKKRNPCIAQMVLGFPVLACLVFGMFESGFFNYTDARTLFFYLMSGILLGEYYGSSAQPAY